MYNVSDKKFYFNTCSTTWMY